ncbi:MAG: YgiQ family radical SAM protein, partial [Bacteroidetes bacterium]|nr:YgiQ family radical SAM protein [Bacteroidota bacterium]
MTPTSRATHDHAALPPTSVKEMRARGWEQADVILFTGDAFVDHPAFGAAVIARVLEHEGLKVAVVPQPNWRDDLRDFKKLGSPRLFFGVTSGNMDSMVNHYTANKRLRSNDAYTPGNLAGQRPDYAVAVYSNILRDLFPDTPIILGGIEASLRRFTHYDYWSDSLKPSILVDSRADLVVYGLGEQAIVEVARALNAGQRIDDVRDIPQTVYRTNDQAALRIPNAIVLSSFDDCQRDKHAFGQSFIKIEQESNSMYQKHLIEPFRDSWIVVNPSYPPQSTAIVDAVYDLPFTRRPHPRYDGKGPIPAFEMIKDSVNIHRGCFGGCSFCTISAHQGKFISSRSKESVLKELRTIAASPDFKGHITDVGGPSANMYQMEGIDLAICATCKRASCIHPTVCENLNVDHTPMIELYREARQIEGIKKVTIGSGLRYDMLIDKNNKLRHKSALMYIRELVTHHVSGRLKVAPEHVSEKILKLIRK